MKNLKEKYLFELKDILGDDIVLRELSDDELVKELITKCASLESLRDLVDGLTEEVDKLKGNCAYTEAIEEENEALYATIVEQKVKIGDLEDQLKYQL